MNSALVVCFLLTLTVAGIHCNETCGIVRPIQCDSDQCCLLTFIGFCAPLRRQSQRCGGFFHCPCAPGLECMARRPFRRFPRVCVASNSTTSSTTRPVTQPTVLPPGNSTTSLDPLTVDSSTPPTVLPSGTTTLDPLTVDSSTPPTVLPSGTTTLEPPTDDPNTTP